MQAEELLERRINAYPANHYYELLLLLLAKFGVTDFAVEIKKKSEEAVADDDDSFEIVIKKDSCLKDLSGEAQQEILALQKANAVLAKEFDPIEYYKLKEIPGDLIAFPSLFDLVAHKYRKVNPQISSEDVEKLPTEVFERLTYLRKMQPSLTLPKISLNGNCYQISGTNYFAVKPITKSQLHNCLELLVKSTLAKTSAEIDQLCCQYKIMPIQWIAAFGNKELMENFILLNDKHKELADIDGYRPLHYASVFGNLGTSTLLVEKQVDLNPVTRVGYTPLHLAAQLGHLKIVEQLLTTKKIEINKITNARETALFLACHRGKAACVQLLLEHNADPTIINNQTLLPLHTACAKKHTLVVKILLKNYPEQVDWTDSKGWTPLHHAVNAGSLEVVELLLAYNANPVKLSLTGETAWSLSKKLPPTQRIPIQKALLKKRRNRKSINYEKNKRNTTERADRWLGIVIPIGVYVIFVVIIFVTLSFESNLDWAENLITSILIPLIPGAGVKKLADYYIPKLENSSLKKAEDYAKTNRVSAEKKPEHTKTNVASASAADLENATQLSTYAEVIPTVVVETVDRPDTHQKITDTKILSLDEENLPENKEIKSPIKTESHVVEENVSSELVFMV